MSTIKNLSGQEFADFDAWKAWAEKCTDKLGLIPNIHSLVLDFLSFYPWIITDKENGAQASEEFSNKLREQKIRVSSSSGLIDDFQCKDFQSMGYIWYEYFYNFHAMTLLPNGDGTYTLTDVNRKATENLYIPDCVSRIAYNALTRTTFRKVVFPDSFTSISPFKVSFVNILHSLYANQVVCTRYPLNIECDKFEYERLKNGYYVELLYSTFKRVCSVWPAAFEGSDSLFDEIAYLREGGELRRISNDSVYAAYSASNVLQSNEVSNLLSNNPDNVPLDKCKVVAMNILPKKDESDIDVRSITVPESVEVLIVNRDLEELVIQGNPKYVYLDVVPKKIRVNAKIAEVRSRTLKNLYKEYGHKRVVFNLPDLCEEESANAGYIKVTAAEIGRHEGLDQVVEINTDHIVMKGPKEISYRNETVTGTELYLAWNGSEYSFLTVLAYEPMDMVAEKINKAKA